MQIRKLSFSFLTFRRVFPFCYLSTVRMFTFFVESRIILNFNPKVSVNRNGCNFFSGFALKWTSFPPHLKYTCIKPYHDADLNIFLKDFLFLTIHEKNHKPYI